MSRPSLAYALLAAAANVVGAAAVTSRARWSVRALEAMVAFAGGFMISVALADLLPQSVVTLGEGGAMAALLGYVLVHLTQHALVPHFHFGVETHHVTPTVSVSALAGLLLHTFVDGVAIASGFRVSDALGGLVFGAILLHKFPEGLAISSLFLAAGAGRRRALGAAAMLGVATLAGVLATEATAQLARYGLALSAGVMLYVGASNLVPEFQGKPGWRLPASFFAGCGAYLLARAVVAA